MESALNIATVISDLSSTALMALLVIVLGFIVKKFYEKSESERKKFIDEISAIVSANKDSLSNLSTQLEQHHSLSQTQFEMVTKHYEAQQELLKNNINDNLKTNADIVQKLESINTELLLQKQESTLRNEKLNEILIRLNSQSN